MAAEKGLLVRCDTCNGRKKKIGLGGMQKDCDACKGIGWIELKKEVQPEAAPEPAAAPARINPFRDPNAEPVKIIKRKGRKPKMSQLNL